MEDNLNVDVATIAAWACKKKITISHEKSQVTYFTSIREENDVHPQVFYEGALIKLEEKNPRWLGLDADPHFTLNAAMKNKLSHIPSRAKVIKATTGAD